MKNSIPRCPVIKLAAGLMASSLLAAPAFAATFTVTTSAASGAGSFLDAYTSANVAGRSDAIVFDAAAFNPATQTPAQRTITLGANLPSFVGSGLTINGDVNGDTIPDVTLDGATAYSGITTVNPCVTST